MRKVLMIGKLRRFANELMRCRSGNAMMLTAVALPGLLAGVGYGADTAQMYMIQRELQHAADQGAIAGAWTLAYKDTGSVYSNRAEKEFTNNLSMAKKYVAAPIVPVVSRGNYKGGTENTVVLRASVSVNLPFTKLVRSTPTVIAVNSEAAYAAGTIHQACLRTLKKNADGTFQIGNGATVIANCGVMAISCAPGAIKIAENATIDIAKITACNKDAAILPSTYTGELVLDQAIGNYTNDLFGPEPAETTPEKTYDCKNAPHKATYTISEGLYKSGIKVACDTFFNPGIYYVETELDLTANAVVSGYGVMFVLRKGALLKLGGSGANGTGGGTNVKSSLNLTPPTASKLLAMGYTEEFAKKYENVLVISDNTETEVEHQINGNADLHIQGKIHLPKGNMKVNGNAKAADGVCFQITSYTLEVIGGAYLYTLCNETETNSLSVAAGVRLIS